MNASTNQTNGVLDDHGGGNLSKMYETFKVLLTGEKIGGTPFKL